MQTCLIKTLLAHPVSFTKPFIVFDCLYVCMSVNAGIQTMANVPIRDNQAL